MRNKRLVVVLVGAAVFGLVAAVSVSKYLSNAQGFTRNMQMVVVAKVDIPLGTKLVAEQLTTAQFPQNATPDGVFDSVEKLVGRVATTNMAAREPVTEFKLAAEGSEAGLSAVIPEGYRAMAVKVDDVMGVSGFLKPGAMVDVLTVIEQPTDGTKKDPISKIVLQNVKVLASGLDMDKPKNEREAVSVRVVTLQVTPEQAEKLALASTAGKLRLVMRNSIDQGDEQTKGIDKQTLLTGEHATVPPPAGSLKSEQKAMPSAPAPVYHRRRASAPAAPKAAPQAAPAPPPPPRPSVEMINGSKRSTVEFP